MKTEIVKIAPENFSDAQLVNAATLLKNGGLVAFPTETVYGLGANALDAEACNHIFDAKGRPRDNPLIVHVLNPEDCLLYAVPGRSERLFWELAERFMPGPLTIIMPKKSIIPDSVTVGLSTVALRCPSHPVARALIRVSGVPIAAPSANLSGKPSPTEAKHVIEDMSGRIPMILDGGNCEVGLESTVIALKDDEIHLLRPGFVTPEDLNSVSDRIVIPDSVLNALKENERPESPGMKYRHYAPSAPVTMVKGKEDAVISFFREKAAKGFGVLCFEEDLTLLLDSPGSNVISLGSRYDLEAQARNLFSALRKMDSMNLEHIYARETSKNALGLAVSNRLLRACAFDSLEL